jgi:hypothetical protein
MVSENARLGRQIPCAFFHMWNLEKKRKCQESRKGIIREKERNHRERRRALCGGDGGGE